MNMVAIVAIRIVPVVPTNRIVAYFYAAQRLEHLHCRMKTSLQARSDAPGGQRHTIG
jgi:hypothetical protein